MQYFGNGQVFDNYEDYLRAMQPRSMTEPPVGGPIKASMVDAPIGQQMPPPVKSQTAPDAAPSAPNAPQQPPKSGGLFDMLAGKLGGSGDMINRLGAGMLALSNNPNLARLGMSQIGQIQEREKANKTIEYLRKMGLPEGQLQVLAQNPELLQEVFKEMYKSKFGGGSTAEIDTFKYFTEGMTDEQIKDAKLVELGLKPKQSSQLSIPMDYFLQSSMSRALGTGAGEAAVESELKKRESQKTYAGAISALDSLQSALMQTTTGYFAGMSPALTDEQQIADAARANVFQLLKAVVRESGEGVFTDADAKAVMDMLPTRSTNKEAIPAVMQQVKMIIAAKTADKSLDVNELIRNAAGGGSVSAPASTAPAQSSGGIKIRGVRQN